MQGRYEQRSVLEPGQPECRVLVVDDNPENAMVLEQMLGQAGFQVRVAQNGALGVEQFQQWRPHFIWMDVRMPVMNGMEATRRIRELDGGREVKIAAMTASAFKSERNAVMAAGMDDFIGKPYRWNEVFECMAPTPWGAVRSETGGGDRDRRGGWAVAAGGTRGASRPIAPRADGRGAFTRPPTHRLSH